MDKHTRDRAIIEISAASTIWGFAFIAVIWALKSYTPAEVLSIRFFIAFIIGQIVHIFISFNSKKINSSLNSNLNLKNYYFRHLKLALGAGFLLSALLILQTIGLKYTTAAKSGFITTLYVVFVPMIQAWFFKQKSDWQLYLYILLALLGTYLLVGGNLGSINQGDLWTLACSFVAAFHIIYLDRTVKHASDPILFNNFQFLWAFLFSLPYLLAQDRINLSYNDPHSLWGILFLGVIAGSIAFLFQVRAQRILSATTASMLFLLESPMAMLFGFLLLGEHLGLLQVIGAIVILLASYLTIVWEFKNLQTKQNLK